jgi:diguanylate cyclase (GGDEF)-like protein
MPRRDTARGRRRHAPAPDAPSRPPAAPRVAVIGVLTAGVVALAGGQLAWLCLPAALLAASLSRTRAGAAAAALAVTAISAATALPIHDPARPPLALMLLVTLAIAAVLRTVSERLEAERDVLRDFALSDPVTGIANRRSLLLRADYEIARHERARHSFALVMLDLDGFKQLNDRFGHAAGDDLLRDVATALSRAMRAQDTVARFGGDEFCVLAPETDVRGTAGLSAKVRQAVREVTAGMEAVAGSVGVAIYPVDGTTAVELMHAADERLLEAKRRRPSRQSRSHRLAA